MIRASAKNFYNKAILTDPDDYGSFINELQNNDCSISDETRRSLAVNAFMRTAMYDSVIHGFFSEKIEKESIPEEIPLGLKKISSLRYGENPHQKAGLYVSDKQRDSLTNAKIQQGKELSYNNFLDANTAMNCVMEFDDPACVIVKHVNPCGVAIGTDIKNAYEKSLKLILNLHLVEYSSEWFSR